MKPINHVILKIDNALQDEIVTNSGLKLYFDGSWAKEWNAAVTAKIVALPAKYTKSQNNILNQLNVGDEVCISYRIVADFCFKGDGHRFMPITEGSEYQQDFMNGKGESIRKCALPKRSGLIGA